MEKNKFLCIIVDNVTGKTLAEYPDIEAEDWYCARSIAYDQFFRDIRNDTLPRPVNDWHVDSLELEES